MKYYGRALSTTIRRALATFPAILVTGARQTGKTTLLREEFGGSHRYVSLERPDVRARALADPVGFFDDNPAPLILDEIQRAGAVALHQGPDRRAPRARAMAPDRFADILAHGRGESDDVGARRRFDAGSTLASHTRSASDEKVHAIRNK